MYRTEQDNEVVPQTAGQYSNGCRNRQDSDACRRTDKTVRCAEERTRQRGVQQEGQDSDVCSKKKTVMCAAKKYCDVCSQKYKTVGCAEERIRQLGVR